MALKRAVGFWLAAPREAGELTLQEVEDAGLAGAVDAGSVAAVAEAGASRVAELVDVGSAAAATAAERAAAATFALVARAVGAMAMPTAAPTVAVVVTDRETREMEAAADAASTRTAV